MSSPLRLHQLTLPVPDLAAASKFYRWVLGMKPVEEETPEGMEILGWEYEDRVVLTDAAAEGAEEAVGLRVPAMEIEPAAAWLDECELVPFEVAVPPADEDTAGQAWPEAEVSVTSRETSHNRVLVSVRGPDALRLDLHVPVPGETMGRRKALGPFARKSADWRGLENPGLLGVTTGTPDPGSLRSFLDRLGLRPMDGDGGGPIAVGDHQWIVEERDPPGIYGVATMVGASRLKDLVRTLDTFEAKYRVEGSHLIAIGPAGRLLLVHGLRGGG